MNYNLNLTSEQTEKKAVWTGFKSLLGLVTSEKKRLILSLAAMFFSSSLNLLGPYVIGYAIDHYVQPGDYNGVLNSGMLLLVMYIFVFGSSYLQTQWMGGVAQRAIFSLRNLIFNKIETLPIAFFNENKAGDLISRVNNDTDKLSQFFSQALMQFISSIFMMIGSGLFLLSINIKLGLAALVPAMFILLFTRVVSPWVRRKNSLSLKSSGALSAEVQESLNNFKVIIAFNRRDYFRKKFDVANQQNYKSSLNAGVANTFFLPVFGLFSSLAQLIVLAYGIFLVSEAQFSIGLLVSYLAYVTNFYNPLRQLAALWANFQVALAGWDRISQMLSLKSNMKTLKNIPVFNTESLMEFKNVHFGYSQFHEVLHNVSFKLQRGKTYAFVGPTGGGKTTTASIMARLYDPTKGVIILGNRDIRSYTPEERSQKIGFILQEPFLFTGTVQDNIVYGNPEYQNLDSETFEKIMIREGFKDLLPIFDQGLKTLISSSGEGLSLGQRQLIAFMRAVLRKPELLILDEATANIDTITEKLLGDILNKLPRTTTLVIIAHRLNTIENADEIYFVNSGEVIKAGSFQDAMDKLILQTRTS